MDASLRCVAQPCAPHHPHHHTAPMPKRLAPDSGIQGSTQNKVTGEWEDHQNTQDADEDDENEGQEAEGEYLQVPENQDVPGGTNRKLPENGETEEKNNSSDAEKDSTETMELFNAMVPEMLNEVQIKNHKLSSIRSALDLLTETLTSMPMQKISIRKKQLNVPIFGKLEKELTLAPPGSVEIVGSFVSETIAKPYENVDLVVRLQRVKQPFHRNYNVINHRSVYLWHVAEILEKIPRFRGRCKFAMLDTWRVILLVKPRKDPNTKLKTRFVIRILTTVHLNKGLHNFLPNCQNIDDELSFATPHYNAAIWEDLFMDEQTQMVGEAMKMCPLLRETIILFKVWLYQRNTAQSSVWPSSFHLSLILAHLVHEGVLKPTMNHFQLFKFALMFLDTHDFTKQNTVMRQRIEHDHAYFPAVEELWTLNRQYFPVALIDCSGQNLMYKVSESAYKEFLHCVRLSLQQLDTHEGFEALFLRKLTFEEDYDFLFRVTLVPPTGLDSQTKAVMTEWDWRLHASTNITKLLRGALGDRVARVSDICMLEHESLSTKVKKDVVKESRDASHILFGLKLQPENSWKTMIVGPSANDTVMVPKFKALWGEKVEIRRFKDGRIILAVVFEEPTHMITCKIVEHLLKLHFSIETSAISFVTNIVDPLLYSPGFTDTSRQLMKEYQGICTILRAATLPLSIVHIMPSDPAMRGTDPAPPRPVEEMDSFFYCNRPVDMVLQMEASGRWPRSVVPLQKTKAAFYIQIGNILKASGYYINSTETGVEASKDFIFRITIQHPYEVTYMRAEQNEIHARSLELFYRPLHHSNITGACGSFLSFGPVCRLAKRWMHTHMLSPHFYEEAVELIVAYLFIHPAPLDPPGSPLSGFLRFLRLVSTHSWHLTPLIVNLDGSLKQKDIETIQEWSKNRRNKAMYIASSYDQGSGWTLRKPSVMVTNRLADLARTSLQVLQESIQRDDPHHWKTVFIPQMAIFPILLKVNERKMRIQGSLQHITFQLGLRKVPPHTPCHRPYSYDHPVQKLIDLIQKYYSGVQCFYDELGGNVIGIAVKQEHEELSTPLLQSGVFIQDTTVTPNIEQLVEDLQEICGELAQVIKQKSFRLDK